jgi:hypothetical protein
MVAIFARRSSGMKGFAITAENSLLYDWIE